MLARYRRAFMKSIVPHICEQKRNEGISSFKENSGEQNGFRREDIDFVYMMRLLLSKCSWQKYCTKYEPPRNGLLLRELASCCHDETVFPACVRRSNLIE